VTHDQWFEKQLADARPSLPVLEAFKTDNGVETTGNRAKAVSREKQSIFDLWPRPKSLKDTRGGLQFRKRGAGVVAGYLRKAG